MSKKAEFEKWWKSSRGGLGVGNTPFNSICRWLEDHPESAQFLARQSVHAMLFERGDLLGEDDEIHSATDYVEEMLQGFELTGINLLIRRLREIPTPCTHRQGYWIEKGESFRCYDCQHQFRVAELPKMKRKIETFKPL